MSFPKLNCVLSEGTYSGVFQVGLFAILKRKIHAPAFLMTLYVVQLERSRGRYQCTPT